MSIPRQTVGRAITAISALAALFAGLPAAAQDARLTGAWEGEAWSTEGWPLDPPFTDTGRAAQEAWAANPDDDPSHRCIVPLGRIISAPMPHEFIVEDERVVMLYEYEHQIRRVFMDGRNHPADFYPTLMGHSIGRWEGNTLVVETVGMEAGLFRPQGLPYTENLRLTERYTLSEDGERLSTEWTIDDPVYYAEPWTVEKSYARLEGEILDYDCIVRPHLGDGDGE